MPRPNEFAGLFLCMHQYFDVRGSKATIVKSEHHSHHYPRCWKDTDCRKWRSCAVVGNRIEAGFTSSFCLHVREESKAEIKTQEGKIYLKCPNTFTHACGKNDDCSL